MTAARAVAVGLAALSLGVALPARVAGADPGAPEGPRHTVAILGVVGPSDDVAASFERDLEAQLGAMRIRLLTRTTLREKLRSSSRWTEGCVVGTCLEEVRARAAAGVVLLAALTGSGTTFGYVVTLVRTDTGRPLAQESDRCDVCTESEAMGRATLAAVKLVNAMPDRIPDAAVDQIAAVDVAVNAVNRKRAAERRHHRRIGWTLAISGLAIAGAGAAIYLATGDRPAYGLATAAGGGGLALGGLAVLRF